MSGIVDLAVAIARVGASAKMTPPLEQINAFSHFFVNGALDVSRLDERDGGCTRRELLLRALLLNAVLDQGPDIAGVRDMMVRSINRFYENEIRIFHTPLDFFKEINVTVNEIWRAHEQTKAARADQWAEENQSTASKYNLYMDNTKQTLNYAVFRWGVPLALPYLLSQRSDEPRRPTALLDYLEGYPSAEAMSRGIKDHELFGLGKAIGDKACHLFAKWMVSTFNLARIGEPSWGEYSYEVPFDSNAGRVLWRTGYLLALSDIGAYRKAQVAQPNAGKGGTEYIRVTNLRGIGVSAQVDEEVRDAYKVLCVDHLRSHKNAPQKLEIQRFQHPILYLNKERVSDFDDGLIEIGRNYCYNHENPDCAACPINRHCQGYQSDKRLITEYRT